MIVQRMLVSQHEMVFASPPKVQARNTASPGALLLAGIIYAQSRGLDLVEVPRWGVAIGGASVETEGVSEFEIERVQALFSEVESRVINVM